MNNIKIKDLNIKIDKKLILKNINLEINKNDIVAILGPNGHGKSTLLKSIMMHYSTEIASGQILIDDLCINNLSTDQITNKGICYISQHPVEIPGLKTIELLRNIVQIQNQDKKISMIDLYKNINDKMTKLNLKSDLLNRYINENFSGGERKKSEILQMELMDSDFIMLDEIDSGLDVDAINTISKVLVDMKNKNKSIIFISHNKELIEALKPNKVILILNGSIHKIGDYNLAVEINNNGYKNLNINLNNDTDDEFLKSKTKQYYCNGK